MINSVKNEKGSNNSGGNIIYINKVSQFELWKAIYDSRILSTAKLTQSAKLVLIGIARHYNPSNEDCYPSYNCLCEHCGVSRKSVERAIKELVSVGFITYRTNRVNRYRFTGHFFTSVNLTIDQRQFDARDQRQFDALTNKDEKIKNSENFLKNSSNSEASQEIENREAGMTSGTTKTESNQNQQTQIIVVERRPAKNSKNKNTYSQKQKRGDDESPKKNVCPTDGGSCRVPSVEETQAYLEEVRNAREEFSSPRYYEREKARRWFATVGPLLRDSKVGRFLYEKYNGWEEEGGWRVLCKDEEQ